MANELMGGLAAEISQKPAPRIDKKTEKIHWPYGKPEVPVWLVHPLHGKRLFTDLNTMMKALEADDAWVDSPAKLKMKFDQPKQQKKGGKASPKE